MGVYPKPRVVAFGAHHQRYRPTVGATLFAIFRRRADIPQTLHSPYPFGMDNLNSEWTYGADRLHTRSTTAPLMWPDAH